jgi:hypothetical protein
VSQGLPVEGLGEVGDGRWRAARGSSSSGERRLKFRRARVGDGNGVWSRSSRVRRGPDSEAQLRERGVGRGSSTWSRGGGNGNGAAAGGVHALEAWVTRIGSPVLGGVSGRGQHCGLGRLLSPAVVEQEVAVASGAGSPWQEDGEVAREEGNNGEGLGR